ncbi:methyltransferase-like protein 22 isoform X3 [Physeter macrocephalus]|uniref:Methyltransferase-like protein 22 isoform X3 n=1 Tax=Physeter macrocephalus TaxID=9755 RepID=A0A455B4U9_PHYMC|nr:methyltransferase-like protein 22 isoform X3 [Physeter catodon]|eukprot:XP_028343073.1 methyltransferase-like protein 22 isoform X3 [Physeter catodon]
MVDGEPRPWLPSPALAMDEITFKSDTVLSDVHLHTPNQRHLMVRLSGVGQPVFLSQFKLLWNQASQADSGAEGGDHRAHHAEVTPPARSPPGSGCSSEGVSLQAGADATSQEGVAAQLDEDGDLDVVRRPRAASPSKPSGPPRDKVHPMILTQEEDDVLGDEAQESGPYDVIKIEHTMATPLEDVGKQVWRGALLLADYILSQRDLFQGRTVLELGAGTGLASILAATVAQTVYCTDVGADLLAMCQRNIALNSHLTATGGRRALPGLPSSCLTCPSIQSDLSKMHLTPSLPAEHLPGVKPELFLWLQTSWFGPGRLFLSPVLAAPLSSPASSEPRAHFTCSPLCPERPGPVGLTVRLLPRRRSGVIKVKELDWLKDDLCTDPEVPFSWSEEDISDLYGHTTILLAAEVCRLAHRLKNASTAIFSVEKRLNFTLRHLDVTCEAYDHFRSCLRRLEGLTGGRLRFVVEPVDVSFPQLLVYERIQQLELWKVFVEPVTEPIVSADTVS